MSKTPGNVPPKAGKVLGIGGAAKKPTGIASAGSAIKKALTGKTPTTPKPTAFKTAEPKTTGKMKPSTPIIGASRGGNTATSQTINADRMKSTIKKMGM